MNIDCIQTDLKIYDNEAEKAARRAPLDYSYISGQIRTLRKTKDRFPDHERWYSGAFREFAETAEHTTFSYLGTDWIGDIAICTDGVFSPRWCREYQRRSYARVYSFAESCVIEDGCDLSTLGRVSASAAWFLTLTVKHSITQSYVSHRKTVEDLRRAWSLIRRWVNRQGFRYLRVMEPGEKNGYAHYHMIEIGGSDVQIEELKTRWLNACHSFGNMASEKAQQFEKVENIQNVGAYVSKYVQKGFCPDSEDSSSKAIWWRWMELAYRERIRVYAMDQKSSRYISKKYPKKDSGVGEIQIFSEFGISGEDEDSPDMDEEKPAPTDTPPNPIYCPRVGGGARNEESRDFGAERLDECGRAGSFDLRMRG